MARVRYGTIVQDARGSQAGVTYTRARTIATSRSRQGPAKRLTPQQSPRRAAMYEFLRRWGNVLTQAQRNDWNTLALSASRTDAFGNTYHLTGAQLYASVNRRRREAGLTILDTAPPDLTVTALATVSITFTAPSTLTITFTPTPTGLDHRLYIFASRPSSPGSSPDRRRMTFIGVSPANQSSPFAAGSLYTSRLGNLISGRRVSVAVAMLRDSRGWLSPFLVATV
jgi:hypothetical protein